MAPFLVIVDERGERRIVAFEQQELTVGRSPWNAICLPARNVSREHLRLVRDGLQVFVEDLSTANPSRVNGVPDKGRVPLNAGDQLQVGDYLRGVEVPGGPTAGLEVLEEAFEFEEDAEVNLAGFEFSSPPGGGPGPGALQNPVLHGHRRGRSERCNGHSLADRHLHELS